MSNIRLYSCVILLLSCLFSVNAFSNIEFPGKYWNRKHYRDVGIDEHKVKKLLSFVFSKSLGHETHSFVIVKDGSLIFNGSTTGFMASRPHRMWSITKSITGALAGTLVQRKIINIDHNISRYYPSIEKSEYDKITIKHLLTLSSGLDWNEVDPRKNPFKSDAVKLLYLDGHSNMPNYALSKNIKNKAGTVYNYSSGDALILSGIFKKSLDTDEHQSFPWTYLFDKIGVKSFSLEKDLAGHYVTGAYGFMSALDLARFGLLYLNKGKWKSTQVLPESWVKDSTQAADYFKNLSFKKPTKLLTYGYLWKLAKEYPENNLYRKHADMTSDIYYATGHHGQYLIVIPSHNIVVVRTGADIKKKKRLDINKVVKLLLNSVEGK